MGRFSLEGYTDKCVRMLNDMINPKFVKADKQIPATLMRHCEGIAFITIFKAGMFFLGGNVGAGCVIVKIEDKSDPRGWRWSGPSAVVCGGLGGGFIFGAEKIDSMIILNTKTAARAFMGGKQVTLGGNLSLAAGPIGRDAEAHVGASSNKELVAAYSYSKSQGLFIGMTLEGAFLTDKNSDNIEYYGDQTVTAARILSGEVKPPLKVDVLHRELYMIQDRKGDYAGLESSRRPDSTVTGSATGSSMSSPPSDVAGADPTVPPPWRKVFTADGKAYYHNVETNETRWDPPVAPAAAPTPAAAPAAPANPYGQPPAQQQQPSYGQPPAKPDPYAQPAMQSSYRQSTPQPAYAAPQPIYKPPAQPTPAYTPPVQPTPAYTPPPQPQISRPVQPTYGVPPTRPVTPPSQGHVVPPCPGANKAVVPPRPVPVRPGQVGSPASPRRPSVQAKYDYTATRPDELSFRVNDSLEVLDKSDPNWWKCSNAAGQSGMVPANYF